jgi:prepilin-type N-terminal cleavage/methylation domain-containing protein
MKRQRGFSLVEMMVVVAIAGALVVVAAPALRDAARHTRLKGATRDIAGALHYARAQAIRTRVNHIVMFGTTPNGNPLPSAAIVLTDDDADGQIDLNETVMMVPRDPGRQFQGLPLTAAFGKTLANGVPADAPDPLGLFDDATDAVSSFQDPSGAATNQIVFQPDGIPRTYDPGPPFDLGTVGSGGGAIFLTNGDPATGQPGRDYAIVVQPLGGVRVSVWNPVAGAWQ